MPEADQLRVTTLATTTNSNQIVALAGYTTIDKDIKPETQLSLNKIKGLVTDLCEKEHYSVLEHISFTFYIENYNRSGSHQFVRHRIASYTQTSQQYIDYSQKDRSIIWKKPVNKLDLSKEQILELISTSPVAEAMYAVILDSVPEEKKDVLNSAIIKELEQIINSDEVGLPYAPPAPVIREDPVSYAIYRLALQHSDRSYNALTKRKVHQHFARDVAANAVVANLTVTMNARSLDNFFMQRICNREFHPTQTVAKLMYIECAKESPWIFNPDSKVGKAKCVREGRSCPEGPKSCGKVKEKGVEYERLAHIAEYYMDRRNKFGNRYSLEQDLKLPEDIGWKSERKQ